MSRTHLELKSDPGMRAVLMLVFRRFLTISQAPLELR
jgi:hypothetical protein